MEEQAVKKAGRKGLVIGLIAAAVVVLAVVIGIVAFTSSPGQRYKKQIALAEKYVSELDYDNAIAAYQSALDIDPKSPEAYEGLAKAYIAMQEEEKALEILKAGLAQTEDEGLKQLEEEVVRSIEEKKTEALAGERKDSEGEEDTNEQGEEEDDDVIVLIAKALDEDDRQQAVALMKKEAYQIIADELQADIGTDRMLYQTKYGNIGLYRDEFNDIYLYFGGFDKELRSGEGVWITLYAEGSALMYCETCWENDLPQGEFHMDNYSVGDDGALSLSLMKTGAVVDGLYDGRIRELDENGNMISEEDYDKGLPAVYPVSISDTIVHDDYLGEEGYKVDYNDDTFIYESDYVVEMFGGPQEYLRHFRETPCGIQGFASMY